MKLSAHRPGKLTLLAALVAVFMSVGAYAFAPRSQAADRTWAGANGFALLGLINPGKDPILVLYDVANKKSLGVLASGNGVSWSPDGRRVAYVQSFGTSPGVWVHDLYASKAARIAAWPGNRSFASDLAWSADGTRIAFTALTSSGNRIQYVDLRPWKAPEWDPKVFTEASVLSIALGSGATSASSPSFSPDKTTNPTLTFREITGTDTTRVIVVKLNGADRRVVWSGTGNALTPHWSNDGSRIAHRRNSKIYVRDMALSGGIWSVTMFPEGTATPNQSVVGDFAFNPKNKDEIAFRAGSAASSKIARTNNTASVWNDSTMLTTASNMNNLTWSPDGTTLMFDATGGVYTVLRTANNQIPTALPTGQYTSFITNAWGVFVAP